MGNIISSTSVSTPYTSNYPPYSTAESRSQGISTTNMPVEHEDTVKQILFSNHELFEDWFKTLSKYNLFPSIVKSDRMKYEDVNSSTFPWLRRLYKCSTCNNAPCGFKLTYVYSCKEGKIIVTFNPGIHEYRHQEENGPSIVISRQNQLTEDELEMIRLLGLSHASRGSIQNSMNLYSHSQRKYNILQTNPWLTTKTSADPSPSSVTNEQEPIRNPPPPATTVSSPAPSSPQALSSSLRQCSLTATTRTPPTTAQAKKRYEHTPPISVKRSKPMHNQYDTSCLPGDKPTGKRIKIERVLGQAMKEDAMLPHVSVIAANESKNRRNLAEADLYQKMILNTEEDIKDKKIKRLQEAQNNPNLSADQKKAVIDEYMKLLLG